MLFHLQCCIKAQSYSFNYVKQFDRSESESLLFCELLFHWDSVIIFNMKHMFHGDQDNFQPDQLASKVLFLNLNSSLYLNTNDFIEFREYRLRQMLNFRVSIRAMVVWLPCSTPRRSIMKRRASVDRIYAHARVLAASGKDRWNWLCRT